VNDQTQDTSETSDGDGDHAEAERLHEVRSEITLLHAYNALLLRRVQREHAYTPEELERHAETMGRSVERLARLLGIEWPGGMSR
jgi:hypothetical protein